MTGILVTGASGMLGWNIVRVASGVGPCWGFYRGHPLQAEPAVLEPMDLRDGAAVRRWLTECRPRIVIHCAAMTDVRACEADPEGARGLNAEASGRLAEAVEAIGGRLLYISTDLVFGRGRGPFSEEERPEPGSCYGRTKLLGESLVAEACSDCLVVRSSIMYGASPFGGRTFSEWVLGEIRRKGWAGLYTDEVRSVGFVEEIAAGIVTLALGEERGVIHLAGPEPMTRHAFGLAMADAYGFPREAVRPARREDFQGTERPSDVSLAVGKAERILGRRLSAPSVGLLLSRRRDEELGRWP